MNENESIDDSADDKELSVIRPVVFGVVCMIAVVYLNSNEETRQSVADRHFGGDLKKTDAEFKSMLKHGSKVCVRQFAKLVKPML